MSDLFYLQDSRSNVGSRAMFWREGGGYTSNLDEAEQFKRESAVKQYECRETDLPWPVDYVRARAEVGVDCQYLTRSEAEAYRNEDGRVYVAYAREWDGNDLVWRGGKGPTANLEDAIHPGAADAAGYLAQGFELWPCGYIVERSRPVVLAALLDHKQALRSVGLKLPKPKRPRSHRHSDRLNCDGCGRFLSDRQRFEGLPQLRREECAMSRRLMVRGGRRCGRFKRLLPLLQYAQGNGWSVVYTNGGHLRFTKPERPIIHTSSTPSDWRAVHNALALLARADRMTVVELSHGVAIYHG